MKRYSVRVVVFGFQRSQWFDALLHCFSQATARVVIHRNDTETVFDLRAGRDCEDSREWATRVAGVFENAGFNAVAAPEWKD